MDKDTRKKLTARAQELRGKATKEENHLWFDFLKNYEVQFLRQYRVGNFYLDFYCRSKKLCIELDGSQHFEEENEMRDARRTRFLNEQGIRVIRFTNREIWENFEGVCRAIDYAVQGQW